MFAAPYVTHSLDNLPAVAALFDPLPDVVFSARDLDGRFTAISQGCVGRHALRSKQQALGRSVHELFPAALAQRYSRHDQRMLSEGRPLRQRIDPTCYPDGSPGWCLSNKQLIYNPCGQPIGLLCLSRDLSALSRAGLLDDGFVAAVEHIQQHFNRRLPLIELCQLSGLSLNQLDRRMQRLFQASTSEFIRQTRMEAASYAICHSAAALADIAADYGFCDQSALTRQCRQQLGLSPRQLRHAQA